MGPLALIEMAGLDILVSTDQVMNHVFPHHGRLSRIAVRLVGRGHVGRKTGAGVYQYAKGDYTPWNSRTTDEIVMEELAERFAPRQRLREMKGA